MARMIRQHLFDKRAPADPMFRWRGGEVSRLEALTDAVFAFALTLIVVSLEVPQDFDDLYRIVLNFPVFAICFALLVMVWYYHYKFFRRFGLEDFPTVLLNIALLFVVLFYVYPLKFVFTGLMSPLLGLGDGGMSGISLWESRLLMIFYSSGVVLIFGLFVLMHRRAYKLRDVLELDDLELYLTRTEIGSHLISMSIGVVSILLAIVGGKLAPMLAGMVYFSMGPVHGIYASRRATRAEAMQRELLAQDEPSDAS